jgi:hypothetical protein
MVEEVAVGLIVVGVVALSLRSAYRSFKRGQPGCGCGLGSCPIDRSVDHLADADTNSQRGPTSGAASRRGE